MLKTRKPRLDSERAETIAAQALAFIAGDGARLTAFITESGIDVQALLTGAGSRPVLAAVLDYLLRDESALLVFSADSDLTVDDVTAAHVLLSGGSGREWDSL